MPLPLLGLMPVIYTVATEIIKPLTTFPQILSVIES